jgi:hypothetical protein
LGRRGLIIWFAFFRSTLESIQQARRNLGGPKLGCGRREASDGHYSSFANLSELFNLFYLICHLTPLLGKVEVLSPNVFVCRQQRMAITVRSVSFTNITARGHCLGLALLRIGLKFFYRGKVQGGWIFKTALR